MKNFWKSDTYAIVKTMKATGNQAGIIEQWVQAVGRWAQIQDGADAASVKAWLPYWHYRPLYAARELVPLWPVLAIAIGFTTKVLPAKSAARLENELVFAGLPFREINGCKYFIVEQQHIWRDAPLPAILEIIYGNVS